MKAHTELAGTDLDVLLKTHKNKESRDRFFDLTFQPRDGAGSCYTAKMMESDARALAYFILSHTRKDLALQQHETHCVGTVLQFPLSQQIFDEIQTQNLAPTEIVYSLHCCTETYDVNGIMYEVVRSLSDGSVINVSMKR